MEVSAKYGSNVQEAFQLGSEEVLKKIENGEINPASDVLNLAKTLLRPLKNYGIKICRELKGRSTDPKKGEGTGKGGCCGGGQQ